MARLVDTIMVGLLVVSCNGQVTKEVTNEKDKLVGFQLQSLKEYQDEIDLEFELETIKSLYKDFNYDGKTDTVHFKKITDWGDPGDFHEVEFKINGLGGKKFFNGSGWVRPREIDRLIISQIKVEESEYSLVFSNEDKNTFFVFYGYPYASHPWITSVVNVTSSSVELIFNDNQVLSEITNNSLTFLEGFKEDKNAKSNSFKIHDLWLTAMD